MKFAELKRPVLRPFGLCLMGLKSSLRFNMNKTLVGIENSWFIFDIYIINVRILLQSNYNADASVITPLITVLRVSL